MQRWQGRVAVVTGASSGIGAEVCRDLVQHGVTTVGLARREERLQALSEELKGSKEKFHYLQVDLLKEDQIVSAFAKIKNDVGGVDIMINNAGLAEPTFAKDGEMDKWETMYRLNVFAVGICTREALKSMKERGVDDGHIINVSSMAAHRLSALPGCAVYSSTKAALKFLSEAVRRELVYDKSKIKVTALKEELKGSRGNFHYVATDLMKENEIVTAFDKIKKDIGGIDILVNNAGIAIPTFVKDCEVDKWQTMFGLHVFAVGICSREALKSMRERGVDDGHIINVSSIAAHRVSTNMPAGVYCASKTALKFLSESLRRELVNDKSKIKVTHLSPGFVATELLISGGWHNMKYDGVPHIMPDQIADAVHYILGTPPDTQVNELIVRPVGEGI